MSVHDSDCECDTYGCQLRRKGVQISPAATPHRQTHVHRPITAPSWEKGTVGENRPGGTRMPYLDANLNPIGVKAFAENRHKLTSTLRRVRNPSS